MTEADALGPAGAGSGAGADVLVDAVDGEEDDGCVMTMFSSNLSPIETQVIAEAVQRAAAGRSVTVVGAKGRTLVFPGKQGGVSSAAPPSRWGATPSACDAAPPKPAAAALTGLSHSQAADLDDQLVGLAARAQSFRATMHHPKTWSSADILRLGVLEDTAVKQAIALHTIFEIAEQDGHDQRKTKESAVKLARNLLMALRSIPTVMATHMYQACVIHPAIQAMLMTMFAVRRSFAAPMNTPAAEGKPVLEEHFLQLIRAWVAPLTTCLNVLGLRPLEKGSRASVSMCLHTLQLVTMYGGLFAVAPSLSSFVTALDPFRDTLICNATAKLFTDVVRATRAAGDARVWDVVMKTIPVAALHVLDVVTSCTKPGNKSTRSTFPAGWDGDTCADLHFMFNKLEVASLQMSVNCFKELLQVPSPLASLVHFPAHMVPVLVKFVQQMQMHHSATETLSKTSTEHNETVMKRLREMIAMLKPLMESIVDLLSLMKHCRLLSTARRCGLASCLPTELVEHGDDMFAYYAHQLRLRL